MINEQPINRLIKALESIENSIYPTLKKSLNKNKKRIKEVQTQEQLFNRGEDAKGSKIRPKYASRTVSVKLRKRQPTDRVTLKDTGDFYQSIQITAEADKLVIETSIEHAKYLVDKYGEDILGIQEQELEDFLEKYIEPELEKAIFKIISKA